MKKIIYSLMALAAAALMSSCQKEVNSFGTTDEMVAVNLSLGLQDGAQTRAISDGTTVDQLIYSLFREELPGKWVLQTNFATGGQASRMVESWPTTETVNLAKGQDYKLVFWAQKANTGIYELAPSTDLTIHYEGKNNAEERDAFYAVFDIKAADLDGKTELEVVLKRPFAQVNVGVTAEDWQHAEESGISVTQSRINIANVASKFNLLTNTPSVETYVKYTFADIPAEDLKVDMDGDGVKEAYKWLSMSYVLPIEPENSDNLTELSFEFATNGYPIQLNKGLYNVPIQRNWRTNIIGQILTGTIDLKISIDSEFENDKNFLYTYPASNELVRVN